MEKLINLSLSQYLDNAKGPEANPGGGSVAAYVGGLGTALSIMALKLSYGKDSYEEKDQAIRDEIEELKAEYEKIIDQLAIYVDEDSNSFNAVLQAFKMPKDTDEEEEKRHDAIQEGYKNALNIPLDTARLGQRVLSTLNIYAENSSPIAISDVGCSVLFVSASIEASLQNVLINMKSIKDEDFLNDIGKEVRQIIDDSHKKRDQLMEIIYERIEKEA